MSIIFQAMYQRQVKILRQPQGVSEPKQITKHDQLFNQIALMLSKVLPQ